MSDPADDLLRRCSTSALLSPVCPPTPWDDPNSKARRFGFEQQAPRRFGTDEDAERARRLKEFNDLLDQAYGRMFPPHLYPPLWSEPYLLRASYAGPVAGVGFRVRVVDWAAPVGAAFTVQEMHLRANAGGVACQVGIDLHRGDRRSFTGSVLATRHPDGGVSVQPPILPLSAFDGTVWITSPFTMTIQPGERIGIDLTCDATAALNLTLHLQLRGYTYPTEQTR